VPGSHAQGNVDHRLKEIIRILLARFANDKYFSALRSRKAQDMGLTEARIDAGCYEYESDASFTEAEKWALRYADQMFLDATKIDAAFYQPGQNMADNFFNVVARQSCGDTFQILIAQLHRHDAGTVEQGLELVVGEANGAHGGSLGPSPGWFSWSRVRRNGMGGRSNVRFWG